MPPVIVRTSTYDYAQLRGNVNDILTGLDRGIIEKGSRVLIKPNLLTAAEVGQAITTHPMVIRAAAEYAVSRGANVQISDSNAMSRFHKVVAVCGLQEALKGLPVTLSELKASRSVAANGKFGTLELSADALDADVIINLPKLKTHSQMGLTLAIKNLFGCVVGFRKSEWHFRVGEDKELFAELLVNIFTLLKPSINLIDGILAMEGNGPGTGGTPRHIGVLAGSTDALSLDIAVCTMVGLDPNVLLTNRAAIDMGMSPDIDINGRLPVFGDFRVPDVRDLLFGPRFARNFIRRHVASRPTNMKNSCKLCNKCVDICPASAIENTGQDLLFDYESCIRCYCCMEACPHGSLKKHETVVKKLIHLIHDIRR
jgi:uncharacterized protein (DUF362 family)/Pyruvate/2-oxoacid:ferredoxin oxidoreductase delta subunit